MISAGADVDAEEEFQNVYNTAREKRMHSLEVQIAREDDFCRRVSPRANFRGCTALHYAVLADNIGVINALLEAGARLDQRDRGGNTPLLCLASLLERTEWAVASELAKLFCTRNDCDVNSGTALSIMSLL